MASRYNRTAMGRTSDIIELSDSEDVYSISDDEPTQEDLNNRRLSQAVNYLNEEGGEDSAETYMDRVGRIHDALLQQLPRQGNAFDQKLYRQVRALVQQAQHDFEDAAADEPMLMDSEDELPQYYTPTAAEDALYRADDSSLPSTPTPAAGSSMPSSPPRALAPRRSKSKDNVEREREFKYGGPKNEVEIWHKDFPASLPFPETLKMAHWESLKIDYDLSCSKESTIVETDIPFEHWQLWQYKHLHQYESGSLFKLPAVNEEDQIAISKIGSLEKSLDAFNSSDQSERLTKDYAPRISLEKFKIGYQQRHTVVSPTRIRRALATSPSKPMVVSPSKPTVKKTSLLPQPRHPWERNPGPEVRSPKTSSTPSKAALAKSPTAQTSDRPGPAIRRFHKLVKQSEADEPVSTRVTRTPTPKSTPIPKPTAKPTTKLTTKTATSVQIPKRGRGRPRKVSLAVSEPSPLSDTPLPSTLGKRKPSDGSQPYAPAKSSIKKVLRDAKRQKVESPLKKVVFADAELEEDSEDPRYPASPLVNPPRAAKAKVTKAAKAGAQAKGVRGVKAVGGRTGTTRSGAKYLV